MNKLFVIVEFDDRFDRKYRGFGNVAVTHCVGKGHLSLRSKRTFIYFLVW